MVSDWMLMNIPHGKQTEPARHSSGCRSSVLAMLTMKCDWTHAVRPERLEGKLYLHQAVVQSEEEGGSRGYKWERPAWRHSGLTVILTSLRGNLPLFRVNGKMRDLLR